MAAREEDAGGWSAQRQDGVAQTFEPRLPNLLELTPVRAAISEERDGRIVLIRPKPVTRGWRVPFDWLIYLLAPRRLKLDVIGSFCWRQIDGRRTAGEIAVLVRREFREECEPAEERLGQFFRLLMREELVVFPELESIGDNAS